MINRPDYIAAISPFIDQPLVKILAGIRRSGKSTILELIRRELVNRGIDKRHIIKRTYTEIDIPNDITAKAMYDEIKSCIKDSSRYYIFLDEVQEIEGWEKAVNNMLESMNVDIYITGSNSRLMASEISTYLTGRYITIPVYTLSFKEYICFKGKKNKAQGKKNKAQRELLDEYIKLGGFPIVGLADFNKQQAYQIVDGIYHTIVSRDIVKRHSIKKQELFDRVVRYIIDHVGETFSANSISNFLKGEHRSISVETVYNYIKWLEGAFVIYRCSRYDIQGRSILKTQEKYFLADVSLKYALLGYNRTMLSGTLENIIYLELKRRGYEVYIGKNADKEIDFIAINKGDKIYVQVCVQLPEDSNREIKNLLDIKDQYNKYVVTLNDMDVGVVEGIRIIHMKDFLLADKW